MAEITKLSITRSFFELETPDLAWKFVWTVRTKYTHKKVQSTHNSAIFQVQILHGSSYGLSNQIKKYKSTLRTKVQKYRSTNEQRKKYKMYKNTKNTWVPAMSTKKQRRAKYKKSKKQQKRHLRQLFYTEFSDNVQGFYKKNQIKKQGASVISLCELVE